MFFENAMVSRYGVSIVLSNIERLWLGPLALRGVLLLLLAVPLLGAGSDRKSFELVGKLIPGEPGMFRAAYPIVSLNGVTTRFSTRTMAGTDGSFKFKHLPTGVYTLVAFLPQVRVLRKTVDIGPSFADAKGRIFLSLPFERQSPNRSRYTISAAQLAVPESARKEYERAQEYLEKRDSERATACLKKAVEIAPQYAGAWNALGNIASQASQFDEAEVYFREALNRNPNYYGALTSLGGALLSQGKIKESLEVFARAVKMRPDDPTGQARLGMTYLQLGELSKAEEHLKAAKKIEPGHFSFPQIFLAEIYTRRKDRDAAILELEEFLKLHPDLDSADAIRETLKQLRNF